MKRLEVSGDLRPIYGSLGVKRLVYENPQQFAKASLFFVCKGEEREVRVLDSVDRAGSVTGTVLASNVSRQPSPR